MTKRRMLQSTYYQSNGSSGPGTGVGFDYTSTPKGLARELFKENRRSIPNNQSS
jgi:hypothetical protein